MAEGSNGYAAALRDLSAGIREVSQDMKELLTRDVPDLKNAVERTGDRVERTEKDIADLRERPDIPEHVKKTIEDLEADVKAIQEAQSSNWTRIATGVAQVIVAVIAAFVAVWVKG